MKSAKLSDGSELEFRRAPLALSYDARQRRDIQVPCEVVLWERLSSGLIGTSYAGKTWRECFTRLRAARAKGVRVI